MYQLLHNPTDGSFLLIIEPQDVEPDQPRFVYDGTDVAILIRTLFSVLKFRIAEDIRPLLLSAEEILVYEKDGDDVVREYTALVRIVKNVRGLIVDKS